MENNQPKNNSGSKRSIARILLLLAAVIWGSSFIVVRNVVDVLPTHWLLFFRFSIGAIVLSAVMARRLKNINRDTVIKGVILGIFLFAFYSVQTLGVSTVALGNQATTAGKSAFLTGFYCVLVPFFVWIIDKKRPDRYNISSAILCIIGIGFIVLNESASGILIGDLLTLLNAAFTAVYIVLAAKYSQSRDEMVLTIIQFVTAAILAFITALIFEPFPNTVTLSTWVGILYLAIFCTAMTLGFQNFGQKYAPASSAALLLSLESPFGALFAVLVGGDDERLTLHLIIGFILVFIAIIISETRLQFLPWFKDDRQKPEQ